MKNILTILSISIVLSLLVVNAVGQGHLKNYDRQWKLVGELIKKGLPKSARAEVQKIYLSAKKENQDAQVIKALVYMTGLQQENREESMVASIREMEKEIAGSKQPAASILKSLTAELYWTYFQNNRYKFYQRSNTVSFKKEDIATWTADDLHKKIAALYLSSLEDKKLLRETRLDPFEAIIIKGNTRKLRPRLYDLLAHRALVYFKNDEPDISRPAFAFEIDQAEAFAPATEFIKYKFSSADSGSLHYKAILIYQELVAFHLGERNIDALIDVDIERLNFVKQYSTDVDKENLYFTAISRLVKDYAGSPGIDQAYYLQAQHYEDLAAQYKPFGDTTHRYDRRMAKRICEKVINGSSASVNTEGKTNCVNLLKQIEQKEIKFSVEKINVPGQPFRALVSYRNFNDLHLRVIKATEALKKLMENPGDQGYWSNLVSATPLKSWKEELTATDDLQQHSVEIKIDALPAGEYVLLAGNRINFDDKKTLLGARLFYVSTISYVTTGNDFFVLDRDNGHPMVSADVQLWENIYNSKAGKYVIQKTSSYKTDANGFFHWKKDKTASYDNNFLLDITYNNERFFLNDFLYAYFYQREEEKSSTESMQTWLFTDRGIYRPGQTVYFKGIVTGKKGSDRPTIRANYATKIYLNDANDEDIDSIQIKTNEFGSFSGKFQLPQNTLNGGFSLNMANDGGSTDIQVEEYKRPKFYVDYEKIKGTYSVNDSIKITGVAKAYAGNSIDNALVKYRVVRMPRFVYPWLFSKWWQPPVREMEIAHGDLKTDKDGKFDIPFKAIPDLSLDKKFEPIFDYKVYADVTDISGETRSGETSVSVSYKSLILQVTMPSSEPVDSMRSISIVTENMSGSFEPAKVNVVITRLEEEKRLIRNRYWERPDQYVMSREEYIRYFPHDEYANEHDHESWQKGDKVFEKVDSVKENGQWKLMNDGDNGKLPFNPGFYVIEITTKDKKGEEVKDVKYIELYDEKSNQLNHQQYIWAESGKMIEPGEKTSIHIGSSADNLFVIQDIDPNSSDEESNKTTATKTQKFITLNNEKKAIEFIATESDRGGYGVNYLFVKHNRFYQSAHLINVPWSNKDLKIEYGTFRDKTLPGSKEKWTVKITGYKNDKLAAEALASMYDASLDQFYPFEWNKPNLWPYFYLSNSWNGSQNFTTVQSYAKANDLGEMKSFKKEYDRLFSDYTDGPFRSELFTRQKMSSSMALRYDVAFNMLSNANDSVQMKSLEGKVSGVEINQAATFTLTPEKKKINDDSRVQIRKNFNETAFFFPDLRTDSNGTIEFSFNMPEALTKWKFQTLAHTKDLAFGLSTREIVTQKQLMVQPNAPRFLREGDNIEFSASIVNSGEKDLSGKARLQLFDAATGQAVDEQFRNTTPDQPFSVKAGSSLAVSFPIHAPYLFNRALTWRIVAKAPSFNNGQGQDEVSDGEEAAMPVLTNKTLVTETLPLNIRGNGRKDFKFETLLNAAKSDTRQNHSLTVEYTSNPAWYAVQALPYLMEYPHECAEQTWNRYYANSLAAMIVNTSPRIKQIFQQWNSHDTSVLLSNLQKNPELKSILLEESPWVLEAKTEQQQKKNIALLFDMVKMGAELNNSMEKLKQMQLDNGGFVWFKGGPDDRNITQYIVSAIGHLKKLKGVSGGQDQRLAEILTTAIPYLDRKIKADYDFLVEHKTNLEKYVPGPTEIQYLYMRSFFPEYKINATTQQAYRYYSRRIKDTWIQQSKYMQGMITLTLYRAGDAETTGAILKSLKETSINNDELGMYWSQSSSGGSQRYGWFWYEAPIETQALLIEAFSEAGKDTKAVDDLKTWLLKNKQTNNWQTTKATAEACYALLLQGNSWLNNEPVVTISLGSTRFTSADTKQEAGTGYFKQIIPGEKISQDMGRISVNMDAGKNTSGKETNSPTWGAVYWQYFENLDKITPATTPLKLSKKLFIEKYTDRGPVISPVNDGNVIKVGDKIKVRIELRVDRDMEYVHMKDMRAASLEPVNVLSEYKWQDGLGYYESTKDASTNFFFANLNKGVYVFEYTLFATQKGNFSNGISNIQCMYAPEFSSHSEGIRITVE